VRAAIQLLFVEGTLSIDGIRERLRGIFAADPNEQHRPIASVTTAELIEGILEMGRKMEDIGLQVKIINGEATLYAGPVVPGRLQAYLREKTNTSGNPEMTPARMEILGCVALRQPISQGEMDQLFDTDKRSIVNWLVEAGLLEARAGVGGRIYYVVTVAFLRKFGYSSIEEMKLDIATRKSQED